MYGSENSFRLSNIIVQLSIDLLATHGLAIVVFKLEVVLLPLERQRVCVAHVELDKLEVAPLAGVFAVGTLVLDEEGTPPELGERFAGGLAFAVPRQTAHHAARRHVVLRVFKLVVVDFALEPKQPRAEAEPRPEVESVRDGFEVKVLEEVGRQEALHQLVIRTRFGLGDELLYVCIVAVVREGLNDIWVLAGTKQSQLDRRHVLVCDLGNQPRESPVHELSDCKLLLVGHHGARSGVQFKGVHLLEEGGQLVEQSHAVHADIDVQLIAPHDVPHFRADVLVLLLLIPKVYFLLVNLLRHLVYDDVAVLVPLDALWLLHCWFGRLYSF